MSSDQDIGESAETTGGGPSRLEAVVLAAGAGSRFGGGKLLAAFEGGVLLDGALRAAFAAPVRSVTLVVGADAEAVSRAARTFAERSGQADRLRIVEARDHARGMGVSLAAGIASLPEDAEGAYVFLGDMPRVPLAVLAPMADALTSGAPAAAPAFEGRRGNPALLSSALFADLMRLDADMGARAILQGLGDRLAVVAAPDAGVLFDVDERADLGR